MTQSKLRTAAEGISVLVILGLAGFSFMPSFQGHETMALDHGRIDYNGYVSDHKFNQTGTLKLANKDQYIGQFKLGRFNGTGKFVSHDGWTLAGKFVNGAPTGQVQVQQGKQSLPKGIIKDGKLIDEN